MINCVTFTGADESVKPEMLMDLSAENPFIEWGILYSLTRKGQPRYPSDIWLDALYTSLELRSYRFSLHVCGQLGRDLIYGVKDAWKGLPLLTERCQRLQINFKHDYKQTINNSNFIENLANIPVTEIILPYDSYNLELANKAKSNGVNVSILFDNSGGSGILPISWPRPLNGFKVGYAGGISPTNITTQATKINSVVGDTLTWIDMETSLRSRGLPLLPYEDYFSLSKVSECIELMKPIIGPQV